MRGNKLFIVTMHSLLICVLFLLCRLDPLYSQMIGEWKIQSSSNLKQQGGETISTVNFNDGSWYNADKASTVLGALVKNRVYPDPNYGTNLKLIPDFRFGDYMGDMSPNSPFNSHWWFRSKFAISQDLLQKGKNIYLILHGINYKANVWLNGKIVADSNEIEGPYRTFELDITKYVSFSFVNVIALEIMPPRSTDLSIRWMQGTHKPPDFNTGIWYDVKLNTGGPVHIKAPAVITKLSSEFDIARLNLNALLINKTKKPIDGKVTGTITEVNNLREGGTSGGGSTKITFSHKIEFMNNDSILNFSKEIVLKNPKLWWPVNVGKQNLYNLILQVETNSGIISERDTIRFGIRDIKTELVLYNDSVPMIGQSAGADKNLAGPFTQKRIMVYSINGKRILIRGGDWTEDMMMATPRLTEETAVRYAKNMNLNTLRLESFWGSDYFFDEADKYGIMIFNGLNCCSMWEEMDRWTLHTAYIAENSLKDQIIRLRNHPSIVTWVLGSDNYPTIEIERKYIDLVNTYAPGIPFTTVMPNRISNIFGYTGYSERPGKQSDRNRDAAPSQWYKIMEGLNWESGGAGGEQLPPLESMREMMPKNDLWPISGSWDIRVWPGFVEDARKQLYKRYGQPTSVEEYCLLSQFWQYESNRAVYEATARRKYLTSGNLKYRYNTGWPALCFQFYDYFLRPNGSFFGTQKACEPLHVQYSYDDSSIYVVNGFYQEFKNLKVNATVFNSDMEEKFRKSGLINIGPDGAVQAFKISKIENLSNIYFLYLEMKDNNGSLIDNNFYWLSNQGDLNSDFSSLRRLNTVKLEVNSSIDLNADSENVTVNISVKNPSKDLAFFIHPTILKGLHGREVLPTYWSMNYFCLLPNQSCTAKATINRKVLGADKPYLKIEGWNIESKEYSLISIERKDVTPKLEYSGFIAPDSVGLGRNFVVSVKVSNVENTGSSIQQGRVYLYIDGKMQSYKRYALSSGESAVLYWPYNKVHSNGKHIIKVSGIPPKTIIGGADHFYPINYNDE